MERIRSHVDDSSLFLYFQYAITRPTHYDIDERNEFQTDEECFDQFLDDIRAKKRHDQGLAFHLNAGAAVVRRTQKNWIPEDAKNGGFGVLVRYQLFQGTSVVRGSREYTTHPSSQPEGFITEESIADEIETAVLKAIAPELRAQMNRSSSLWTWAWTRSRWVKLLLM